jgi:hypothetical protein
MWSFISVAPHMYLISICGMLDRLDVYLWYRVFGANLIFLIVMLWQRRATRASLAAFDELSMAPEELESVAGALE